VATPATGADRGRPGAENTWPPMTTGKPRGVRLNNASAIPTLGYRGVPSPGNHYRERKSGARGQ